MFGRKQARIEALTGLLTDILGVQPKTLEQAIGGMTTYRELQAKGKGDNIEHIVGLPESVTVSLRTGKDARECRTAIRKDLLADIHG